MQSQNELFPIFLKLHALEVLLVGGGNVALEKLTFLLKSSPNANVTVVAKVFRSEVRELASKFPTVSLVERSFEESDLNEKQLLILATDNPSLHEKVKVIAKQKGILTNVADTPAMCDFYLGGIVTKGDLKIAISTNGKSPTLAKRLRQLFEEVIPDDVDELLGNLRAFRSTLKDDFEYKVKRMNELTAGLLSDSKREN
ncbi:MAG: bifunctional precorrin-2 dehydrogenase/sirohydrochlorin ferrochelatase [Flavobacteriales bacterium]|nr:bifunctional precorrin-2 dehydrogenase/sirohydrochlorin ferrochelatase [Flavobacteriales bacterium]